MTGRTLHRTLPRHSHSSLVVPRNRNTSSRDHVKSPEVSSGLAGNTNSTDRVETVVRAVCAVRAVEVLPRRAETDAQLTAVAKVVEAKAK